MSALPADDIKAWRTQVRKQLIAARVAMGDAELARCNAAIGRRLDLLLTDGAERTVAFCWPYKNEPDPRPTVLRMLGQGARAALPVVVAPRTPLAFREWSPGCAMEEGAHGIPIPAAGTAEVTPDLVLLAIVGFDRGGYRLGYGSGFFDRTLAALACRPLVIGIGYEAGRLETIRPQAHDIPLDYVVTEAGTWRRASRGLEASGSLAPLE